MKEFWERIWVTPLLKITFMEGFNEYKWLAVPKKYYSDSITESFKECPQKYLFLLYFRFLPPSNSVHVKSGSVLKGLIEQL